MYLKLIVENVRKIAKSRAKEFEQIQKFEENGMQN